MNVRSFYARAEDCGYNFSCSEVTQAEINTAETFIKARLGITPCTTNCNCCCDDYCAIPHYIYLTKEVAPSEETAEIEKMMIDYLVSKGCYDYGF